MGAFQTMRKLILGSLLAVCAMSCGPIKSTSYLMRAETTLDAARAAGAEQNAPYEWTAAQLYFHKSKHEIGYSDFQQGVDYAKRALDFAIRARDKALKASHTPTPKTSL